MADADSREWWRDGVLGRLDAGGREMPVGMLAGLGRNADALGLDALLIRPATRKRGREILSAARDEGLRILVELDPEDGDAPEAIADAARHWLEAGAAGVSLDLPRRTPTPAKATVTRLYGEPDESEAAPRSLLEGVRAVVDGFDDRVFLGRRANDATREAPAGPHLVVETVLLRKPWRAPAFGQTLDDCARALPPHAWPGFAMGAPRRGPFAVGLSMDDALAVSAALHLTIRGTPCIELEGETELPDHDARRAWYRRVIDLRNAEAALQRGDFRRIRQEKSVLGYLREFEAERLAVLVNFGRRPRTARLPTGFGWTTVLGRGIPEGHRFAGGELSLPGCGVLIARAGAPHSRTLGGTGQRRATGR